MSVADEINAETARIRQVTRRIEWMLQGPAVVER